MSDTTEAVGQMFIMELGQADEQVYIHITERVDRVTHALKGYRLTMATPEGSSVETDVTPRDVLRLGEMLVGAGIALCDNADPSFRFGHIDKVRQ